MDLTDNFKNALDADNAADYDKITARSCTSDSFDGTEYKIYGRVVPIRLLIDVVARVDGHAIEQLLHSDDHEACLVMFVADLPEQPHPAFVDGRY